MHYLFPWQLDSGLYPVMPTKPSPSRLGRFAPPPCATSTYGNYRGQMFLMQPTDYLIGPSESTPDLCLSWPRAQAPSSDGVDWQLGANTRTNCDSLIDIFLHRDTISPYRL